MLVGLLGLVWLLSPGAGDSQESQLSESKVKAAFLFNFAKFVEWPQDAFAKPESPMTIGILGESPFGSDLEAIIQNKTINDRALQIKGMRSLGEITNCHVLFISTSEKKRLSEILEGLHGASVLTVGETEGFTEAGGMINLVREGKKFRFQINSDAARKAKLKISSKLLGLALPATH
ncbi:MAG: hypothetical protein JWR26_1483 [Pedosphaera sp.]|nr:hypothetical protein [Pedosphaera sp.]